jgi:predicted nucleic acid-binding protein
MIKFFIDTCILIDVLCSRAEGYEAALALLDHCAEGRIKLCTSIQSFSNISYILKNEIQSEVLVNQITDLAEIIDITYEDRDTLIKAIECHKSGKIKDFEDAVQFSAAVLNKCNYIITRDNVFIKSDKMVVTPKEALDLVCI